MAVGTDRPHAHLGRPMSAKCQLTTLELFRLDRACDIIRRGFGHPPHLVGSAEHAADYRDVDVRLILPDDEFDALFGKENRKPLWEVMSASLGLWVQTHSGLPVDFQIQRMTEANEKYGGQPRNPLGTFARQFAGGGDATGFEDD